MTADGRVLTASASQNQDLFWGLRGGGGNFGIATSFEFQLHPVGPMLGGILIYPLDQATKTLVFLDDFTRTTPDELGTFIGFVTSPEGERVMAVFVSYNGAVEEGERILKPLREFGAPLADMIGPMPYTQVQRMMDEGFPAGRQNYWKSNFLKGLDSEAIDIIVDQVAKAPSPHAAVAIEQFSGAVNRVGVDDTAFATKTLVFLDDFTRTTPDELGTFIGFVTSPEGERVMAVFVSYNGAVEEGERILKPLREFGAPLADMIGPMPYTQVQRMMDEGFPAGRQNYWKSNFLKGLDSEAIDIIVDQVAKAPSPHAAVAIEQFSGAVNRVGVDDTAFNHRDARYNLLIVGIWDEPGAKDENVKWARDLWNAMEPYSSGGVYVNYLGQEADEGAERVKSAYGPEKYERLVVLKNKYDPTNLFRMNQNIKPSAG